MNHFMNNAKEFLNRDSLKVIIYHGGEMPNETHYTYDINEARKLAQRGEHSEIINSQGILIQ